MLGHARHDAFLDVEAVFGLLENSGRVSFENVLGDFLAAVGGQAVKDDMAGSGLLEETGIDLIGSELGFLAGLTLLTHGEPDIGVHHVCPGNRLAGVGCDADICAVEFCEEVGGWLVGLGGSDGQFEAEVFGGAYRPNEVIEPLPGSAEDR